MSFVIDYVLAVPNETRCLGGPEGMTVQRNGVPDLSQNVVAGDTVCVCPGFIATVDEVGRTEINADGTRQPRTILSGGA